MLLGLPSVASAQFVVHLEFDADGTYRSEGTVPGPSAPSEVSESRSIGPGITARAGLEVGDALLYGLGVEWVTPRAQDGMQGDFSIKSAYVLVGYQHPSSFRPTVTLRGGPALLSGDEWFEANGYPGAPYESTRDRAIVQFPTGMHLGVTLGAQWGRFSMYGYLTQYYLTRRYRENAETITQANRLVDLDTRIQRVGLGLAVGI